MAPSYNPLISKVKFYTQFEEKTIVSNPSTYAYIFQMYIYIYIYINQIKDLITKN